MPIVIWRNGIGKNLQRQSGDGLTEAMVPKTITKSGEKKRGCLATDASESEQDPRDDSLGCRFHHDVDNCFPAADAKGERGFAIPVWHEKNNLLRGAQDQRNHDQSKREPTRICRKAFEPQHDQPVNDNTPGN